MIHEDIYITITKNDYEDLCSKLTKLEEDLYEREVVKDLTRKLRDTKYKLMLQSSEIISFESDLEDRRELLQRSRSEVHKHIQYESYLKINRFNIFKRYKSFENFVKGKTFFIFNNK